MTKYTSDVPLTALQLKAAMQFIKATGKSIVVRPRYRLQGHKLKIEYSDRWYCHTFSTNELVSVRSVYNTAAALVSRIVGEHGSRYSTEYEIV
jgi:hypothetical protein